MKSVVKVAHELELPAEFGVVISIFHISLLKKYVVDPASVVPLKSLAVKIVFIMRMYQLRFWTVRSYG